jgi:DNA-binding NtrC family response regulator
MENEDLENVLKKKLKPIIDDAMNKFLGVTIPKIEHDISYTLAKSPILDLEIDTKIGFKKAKEKFKKFYLEKMLQTNLGNISKVADLSEIDRRSIHRLIKQLKIDMSQIKGDLLEADYVKEAAVKDVIEQTLWGYRGIIKADKLKKMYREAPSISKDIVKELPEAPMTMKEAEDEFEKRFIIKALSENSMNITKTAKAIGLRFETLHRKMKSLGI